MRAVETRDAAFAGMFVGGLRQQILLLESRLEPGVWQLPGGRVRAGERFESALERELHEELGIGVELGEARVERTEGRDAELARISYWPCLAADCFTPRLSPEHRGYAWVPQETVHERSLDTRVHSRDFAALLAALACLAASGLAGEARPKGR